MQTNTQVPGAEQAPSAPAGADDNLTGAELAAAFVQRRSGRPTAPAQSTEPETQPAVSEEPAETAPPTPETAPETTDAPEAETPAEAQPEVAPETTPEPEPEPEETPGIKAMKERIDGLTARLREAERELEREKGSKVEKPKVEPVAGQYDADPELQTINTQINQWRAVEAWLAENPDGGEVTDKAGAVIQTISPQEARKLRLEADDNLSDLRVQRDGRKRELKVVHDQARQQAEALVGQTFAWAKDDKAPQHELIRTIESMVPEIKRVHGWKLLLAHGVDSLQKWKEAQSKPKAATPAPKPPKVATPNGVVAQRVNPAQKQLAEAQAAYDKSGRASDFTKVLELKRKAKLQAA